VNGLTILHTLFGVRSEADVANTIFVLLFAPPTLQQVVTCAPGSNLDDNSTTGPYVYAYVVLQNKKNNCDATKQAGFLSKVNPYQFEMFALSRELDEAITDPIDDAWSVELGTPPSHSNRVQVADPCAFIDKSGHVGPDYVPGSNAYNFTRDSLGHYVAQYVSPDTYQCVTR
jgi:hypothetical protein